MHPEPLFVVVNLLAYLHTAQILVFKFNLPSFLALPAVKLMTLPLQLFPSPFLLLLA
jgi:hypothetical protein